MGRYFGPGEKGLVLLIVGASVATGVALGAKIAAAAGGSKSKSERSPGATSANIATTVAEFS